MSPENQAVIAKSLCGALVVVSVLWFVTNPTYEPLAAIISAVIAIAQIKD